MTASRPFVSALADGASALAGTDFSVGGTACTPETPSGRVPVAELQHMFERAAAHADDPAIALRVGGRFRVGSFAQTGNIYAHASNLRDVVSLNDRYQRLTIDVGDIAFVDATDKSADDTAGETAGETSGETSGAAPYSMVFTPYPECRELPHVVAALMGAYGTAYRWLSWGSAEELLGVDLPFAETRGAAQAAAEIFGCPVRFGRSHGRLHFSDAAVNTPLTTADPAKLARVVARLDRLLGDGRAHASFLDAVHSSLRDALEHGPVNQARLAQQLSMSESALRRRLSAADTGYRAELERVRRELMAEGLIAGESFAHVAHRLGYNDQAAFNHAVRRWYGVAPGEWTPELPLLER